MVHFYLVHLQVWGITQGFVIQWYQVQEYIFAQVASTLEMKLILSSIHFLEGNRHIETEACT